MTVFPPNDQRGEHGPVFGADLIAREEGVLSGQGDGADLIFDRVGVQRIRPV